MKIGIVGGREYPDMAYVCNQITAFIAQHSELNTNFEIISGGASGVDSIAQNYARIHNLDFKVFEPDLSKYGIAAYNIRNKKIADYCDILLAFPSPRSVGSWNTIRFAFNAGKRVIIYPYILQKA